MVEGIMAEVIMAEVPVRTVGGFTPVELVEIIVIAAGIVGNDSVSDEQEGDKGQSSPESRMSGLSYGRWTQLMNSILRLI